MNEGTSTSMPPTIDSPAFAWGEGHPILFAVADRLMQAQFAAQTIMLIDSCFTQAVYGQHADKQDERRIHHMQTLHVNNKTLADDANFIVLQSYELAKTELNKIFTELGKALGEAQALAETCITHFPKVVDTGIGMEALAWCITAYTMVINPVSPVKLVQRPMMPNGPRGFGIVA